MMHLISIFTMSMLSSNIILNNFLGLCPFIGSSKKEKNVINMSLSVMLVVTISSIITYFLNYFVLVKTGTTFLRTIIFILVIVSVVYTFEIILKKTNKKLYNLFGLYFPFIIANCAVLGIILLSITNNYNFIETIIFSIGSSLGFTLVTYLFSIIMERLEISNVPTRFKGIPISLITASIMALLFTRYIGK